MNITIYIYIHSLHDTTADSFLNSTHPLFLPLPEKVTEETYVGKVFLSWPHLSCIFLLS